MKLDFWNKKRKPKTETVPWSQGFDPYHPDTTRSSLFASGEEDWHVPQSAPVFHNRTDGTGRPRSYEDFLRARQQNRPWDGQRQSYRPYGAEDERDGSSTTRRGLQIIGSLALVAGLYMAFHSQAPLAVKTQAFVRDEMKSDSNISALSNWWHQNVADKVTVPTLGTNVSGGTGSQGDGSSNANTTKAKFDLPVQGTVKTPYNGKDQQGITFSTTPGSDVHASASGAVVRVDKNATGDYMVTISHGTAGKTIYNHLVNVSVKVNDWVDPDQTIGTLAKTGDHAELFFAFQKDGNYVNPADILNLPSAQSNMQSNTQSHANVQ